MFGFSANIDQRNELLLNYQLFKDRRILKEPEVSALFVENLISMCNYKQNLYINL
jgi:hypothetical protein